MPLELVADAMNPISHKEATDLNTPEGAMGGHPPLDLDEMAGCLPVSNMQASTALPQPKLDELIASERTKHMARGGRETQENDPFDYEDLMVETGDNAALQLQGLLEDLEVGIESPSRLDPHLETSQKDLEFGSSTSEGIEKLVVPINFEHDAVGGSEGEDQPSPTTMDSCCDSGNLVVEPVAIESDQTAVPSFATDTMGTAIKIGLLAVEGRESGHDSCSDEQRIKPAMLEVKPAQVFVLPLAEEAAIAPNLLSRLPGVQESAFPAQCNSEAAFPSLAHPIDGLQQAQMSPLLSKSLLHKEPGQEQSLVTTLVLRPPRGGALEEDAGANQLLSSFSVNAPDPICAQCTGASEMLNHENTLSNTSIAEVCNLNLMSAGTVTEGFDHSDGAIASPDTVPAPELQGEYVKPGFLPTPDTLVSNTCLSKCQQPESELDLQRGRSDEAQQSLQAAESIAIDVERLKSTLKTVPTSRLQFFHHAPCAVSHVSQLMTLESQDVIANVVPPLASCALPMFTSTRATPVLQGMMPSTGSPNFEEVHSIKEKTACTQEPRELIALAMQAVPSEPPAEPPVIPLAAHLQPKESGNCTVRCAAGPSLHKSAGAPQSLKIQMRMETDKQLQQVQKSAHDAMVAATSVLEQSQGIWARIQTQYPSELGALRDAQIASVTATIVAAASITKAAMEAAKAIVETSNEAFKRLGLDDEEGLFGGESVPLHLAFGNNNGMDEVGNAQVERHMRMTAAATSEGQTKSRAIAAARDTMVQASKATSQAGHVITTGVHLLQAKAVEDAWNTKVGDQVKEVDTNPITRIQGSTEALCLEGGEGTQSRNKSAKKKKKKLKGTQPSILRPNKKSDSQGGRASISKAKKNSIKDTPKMRTEVDEPGIDVLLKRKTQQTGMPLLEKSHRMKHSGASSSQDCAAHKLHIMELGGGKNVEASLEVFGEDSAVEVMSAEEGLRGGWFSARVLMRTDKEAFVIYDELLTDDGSSQLKEWFPLSCVSKEADCSSSGKLIRPAHPISFSKKERSRKRRHIATSSQAWIVGDHVDAFIQDVWWEGVVKEKNEDDVSKLTVYFPGENDTAVVNAWDLRPSMMWTDGQWRAFDDSAIKEDGRLSKQQKVGSASRKGKEEGKLSAEKPSRSVVTGLSPAKRKCKEESQVRAEMPRRSIAIEFSPANKKKHKESIIGADKPTQSMATEEGGPANKKRKESQLSAEKPTMSMMAMELSPAAKQETAKEKVHKMCTEKPTRNMATKISPANRKGKKEKIEVSAANPTASMTTEQSPANMKGEKEKGKVSAEKPAVCMVTGLSPANRKDKEKSKCGAEKTAMSMNMQLCPTNRKDEKEKSKVSAKKHKSEDMTNADKPAKGMVIELSPANKKRKAESMAIAEKPNKSMAIELSPAAKRKCMAAESKFSAEKGSRGLDSELSPADRKRRKEEKGQLRATRSTAMEYSPANEKHEESPLRATRSMVKEFSPANNKKHDESLSRATRSMVIEFSSANKKHEESQSRATRSMVIESSPASKKHEESQSRATRSMAIEFSPANKKHEGSQLRATRSTAVELIPAVGNCKTGDSNMSAEKPTRSTDVELRPAKRKSKKESEGSEGTPSKGKAVEHGLPDMQSLANLKSKKESKVSEETPRKSMAVDLSPDNAMGKKERKANEGMPTRSTAVKLSPVNMKAKEKESKVSEQTPTTSMAVELSPANLKGKRKESKVSEQTPTGSEAVELSPANLKGKKDSKVSTEKLLSRTLEQASARVSSRGLVLNSGPRSAGVSTRNLTKKYMTTLGKGDGRIVNSLANESRSVGELPSNISDALIMPEKISLKTSEKARVRNVITTRMQQRAELATSQNSPKVPSKRHSSKVTKTVCARTVSTRSEARQLRSKTSQMKIYNILKRSTNWEKSKPH